jgi:hypothetical protein
MNMLDNIIILAKQLKHLANTPIEKDMAQSIIHQLQYIKLKYNITRINNHPDQHFDQFIDDWLDPTNTRAYNTPE